MPNIRLDLEVSPISGQSLTFKSPADCSQVTGLILYYPVGDSVESSVFQFADAHGNNIGDLDLFASDSLVKIILDTQSSLAFVQNADTNAYLEGRFDEKQDKYKTLELSLSASKWSSNTQSVSASGVTPNSVIIVTPAPSSYIAYGEAMVYCSAQGDGTLTFTCVEVPTGDLGVNVLIV